MSDTEGFSQDSDPISVFTPQIGIKIIMPLHYNSNVSACVCMYIYIYIYNIYIQVQQYLLAMSWLQLTAPLKYLSNGTLLDFHVVLGMVLPL